MMHHCSVRYVWKAAVVQFNCSVISSGSFKKSVKDFSELLESLVNDPTTRGMSAAIGRIEQMVENIGSFKANASDIIGIYNSFFNEKTKVAKPDEIKAYIEDGHHLFIEIMGQLLNYYRNFVQ